ncbi:PAS domain S-box protein [Streptomyces sp. NPDC026672]|uniref:PAS domain-containing protein n=1 Tax=unclassified Streptomyces TaxID=2593676 RepID=UPI0034091745
MGDGSEAVTDTADGGATTGRTDPGPAAIGEPEGWMARAILRETPEAVVTADPEGIILTWNAAAERMFGYSAEEAVGRSLDLIVPEKQRPRHNKGYEQTMATGRTKYGDSLLKVPATHRDGHRLSLEFTVALVRDDDGEIAGICAVMREVSERRAEEKALRMRLAELERLLPDASRA